MPEGPGRVGLPSFRRWIAGRPPPGRRGPRARAGRPPTSGPSSWPSAGSPSWTPRWISRPSASSRIQIAPPGMPSSAGADPPETQTVCGSNVGCSARVTSRSASRSSSGVGLPQYQKPSQTWWIRRVSPGRTSPAGTARRCRRSARRGRAPRHRPAGIREERECGAETGSEGAVHVRLVDRNGGQAAVLALDLLLEVDEIRSLTCSFGHHQPRTSRGRAAGRRQTRRGSAPPRCDPAGEGRGTDCRRAGRSARRESTGRPQAAGGRSAETGRTASPRRSASTSRTSTVSATGRSSRKSVRDSNSTRTAATASR